MMFNIICLLHVQRKVGCMLYCILICIYTVSVVAIAIAEQKLTMELLHKVAVEELQKKLIDKEVAYTELQRKLTCEKELAVAETKKKQWVLLAFIDVSCNVLVRLLLPWLIFCACLLFAIWHIYMYMI